MISTKKQRIALCAGMLVFLGSAVSARADYNFNFNSLAAFTGTSGDNSLAIAQYMDGVLGGLCATNLNCVTVTGAVTDRTYTGETHVVGPGGVSRTLGNTDGATDNSSAATATTNDTFISNLTDASRSVSSQMIITFSHGVVLNGQLNFDYQIFPDNTCADSTHCPSAPDFKFGVNGGATTTVSAVFPNNPGTNGNSTDSPFSPGASKEKAAQFIGHWSTSLVNVTELDFIDWPAAIGVDNINVTTPEPRGYALLLGGLMLALFVGTKLRQNLAKSSN
jgi:hypothetical protein